MEETTLPLQSVARMISLDETQSTQTLGKELALNGGEANTLILARRQTGGRGQYDRSWSAPEGGVYFSLLLRPNKAVKYSGNLSVKAAEAVSEVLREGCGIKTKIKKPNDVLVWEDKTKSWKKICGILTETSSSDEQTNWLVIGIGVNVNNKIPPALKDKAVSLKQLLGEDVSLEWVLESVLESFWKKYAQWELSNQIAQ